MLYAVLFEDNAAKTDEVRRQFMAAHLAFLERNRGAIIMAGPLRERDGTGAGGMWLVEASLPEIVEELVRADPFWPTGLRRSHRILAWHRVFGADAIAARA
ncbi:YciI family protein [Dongia sp.]|uniref:YciI family protein n=1 Tax=Dongia sp. TaxID=1977262 RepID=UPI0035B37607